MAFCHRHFILDISSLNYSCGLFQYYTLLAHTLCVLFPFVFIIPSFITVNSARLLVKQLGEGVQ